MSELFAVQVGNREIPVAGDRPVVFHGVNKSGSLAMANVLRSAYHYATRADEFFSLYHGVPRDFDELKAILAHSSGHNVFISHYVYRDLELPTDALLVTQVRHPLPRMLSVYGWLRRTHIARGRSLETYPSLEAWIVGTKGYRHTQMSQFAVKHPGLRSDLRGTTATRVYEIAMENFERDVAWFGVAELFEESIFAMAHLCGLRAVPAWQKDTRNDKRPALADTDQSTIDLIHETLPEEFAFYEHAVATFRHRMEGGTLGATFADYTARCADQYGERLISS